MIHPSYVELMRVVNQDTEDLGEMPVVNSRYSIVIASAKRARQLIDGAEPKIETSGNRKALSVAVDEIYNQKVHIIGEDDQVDEEEEPGEAEELTEEGGLLCEDDESYEEDKEPEEE